MTACTLCGRKAISRQLCSRHYYQQYHAKKPFERCCDCRELKRLYAHGICIACYDYQRSHHGLPRRIQRNHPRNSHYCIICFRLYIPHARIVRTCSDSCASILKSVRTYRGKFADCQRCHRYRLIRSKCLCASCYVLARNAMNAMGLYGQCSSRIDRFAGVPGVLNTDRTVTP